MDQTKIVQNVLGGHRRWADPIERKLMIAREVGLQYMHQLNHRGMLSRRVDAEGKRRVGRRRQDIGLTGEAHHVGGVTATCSLNVVRVQRATSDQSQRVLDCEALVETIGVDAELYVVLVRDAQCRL